MRVRPLKERDHLRVCLGDLVDALYGYDDRHPAEDDDAEPMQSWLVLRVEAAFCREVELVDDPNGYTHRPVAGTAVLEPRADAVHHEAIQAGDRAWIGYVVEVE